MAKWNPTKKGRLTAITVAILLIALVTFETYESMHSQESKRREPQVSDDSSIYTSDKPEDKEVPEDNPINDKNGIEDDDNDYSANNSEQAQNDMPTGEEWKELLNNSSNKDDQATSGEKRPSNGEAREKIQLPYSIPNSTLIIKKFDSYDGIYLEDGSDKEITDAAAILVENTGDKDIEYSEIRIQIGEEKFDFKVTGLTRNSNVVALAENEKKYQHGDLYKVSATISDGINFTMSEDKIEVKNVDGAIRLRNRTNTPLNNVRIFYKFYLPNENAYVGGITYTAKIDGIQPDETISISPSHFAGDSSKIIRIMVQE